MVDIYDTATRSYIMSKVKGYDTGPEMVVRKYLHSKGLRYRLQNKKLPGKPDITLPKYHTVIFVNGCFWHGHKGCKNFALPKTRTEWWKDKIYKTVQRDKTATKSLKKLGWNTIIVWECELKSKIKNKTLEKLLSKIIKQEL